jgi:hypothetical protein
VPGPGAYNVQVSSKAPRSNLKFRTSFLYLDLLLWLLSLFLLRTIDGTAKRFIETGNTPFGIAQKVQNHNPGPGAYNVDYEAKRLEVCDTVSHFLLWYKAINEYSYNSMRFLG